MLVLLWFYHMFKYQTSSRNQSQNFGTRTHKRLPWCTNTVLALGWFLQQSRGTNKGVSEKGLGDSKEDTETPLKGHKPAVLTWLNFTQENRRSEGGRK